MAYTPEELLYIVGFFDGEGCVASSIRRNKFLTLHIVITNTNKKQIDWLQSKIGGSITTVEHSKDEWKTSYYLQITGPEAYQFAQDAFKLSKTKSDQLALACLYFSTNGSRSLEASRFIDNELKKLNKRGKPIKEGA